MRTIGISLIVSIITSYYVLLKSAVLLNHNSV